MASTSTWRLRDGSRLRAGDVVLLQSGQARPFVALAQELSLRDGGEPFVKCRWFWRPSDTTCRKKNMPAHVATNEVSCPPRSQLATFGTHPVPGPAFPRATAPNSPLFRRSARPSPHQLFFSNDSDWNPLEAILSHAKVAFTGSHPARSGSSAKGPFFCRYIYSPPSSFLPCPAEARLDGVKCAPADRGDAHEDQQTKDGEVQRSSGSGTSSSSDDAWEGPPRARTYKAPLVGIQHQARGGQWSLAGNACAVIGWCPPHRTPHRLVWPGFSTNPQVSMLPVAQGKKIAGIGEAQQRPADLWGNGTAAVMRVVAPFANLHARILWTLAQPLTVCVFART